MNRNLVARLREAWCNHREGKPFDRDLLLEAADRAEGAAWAVNTLSRELEILIEKNRAMKKISPFSRQQCSRLIEECAYTVSDGEQK